MLFIIQCCEQPPGNSMLAQFSRSSFGSGLAFATASLALSLSACGGSGGGGTSDTGSFGGGNNPPAPPAVAINSMPTANLAPAQSNASSLANEIQGEAPALAAAAQTSSLPSVPAVAQAPGARTISVGAGVTVLDAIPEVSESQTVQCSTLGTSGSGTVSASGSFANPGTITAGDYWSADYDNCQFTSSVTALSTTITTTITLNGQEETYYTRYNSSTDFAFSEQYTNFSEETSSASYGSFTYGPISGTYFYDVDGETVSYYYGVNGGSSNVIALNSAGGDVVINGTYTYNSNAAGGVIQVVFSDWTYNASSNLPVTGSLTVTAANGTVTITAGSGSYTVSYYDSSNNLLQTYTVSYS
jgi:hypothetical protein